MHKLRPESGRFIAHYGGNIYSISNEMSERNLEHREEKDLNARRGNLSIPEQFYLLGFASCEKFYVSFALKPELHVQQSNFIMIQPQRALALMAKENDSFPSVGNSNCFFHCRAFFNGTKLNFRPNKLKSDAEYAQTRETRSNVSSPSYSNDY